MATGGEVTGRWPLALIPAMLVAYPRLPHQHLRAPAHRAARFPVRAPIPDAWHPHAPATILARLVAIPSLPIGIPRSLSPSLPTPTLSAPGPSTSLGSPRRGVARVTVGVWQPQEQTFHPFTLGRPSPRAYPASSRAAYSDPGPLTSRCHTPPFGALSPESRSPTPYPASLIMGLGVRARTRRPRRPPSVGRSTHLALPVDRPCDAGRRGRQPQSLTRQACLRDPIPAHHPATPRRPTSRCLFVEVWIEQESARPSRCRAHAHRLQRALPDFIETNTRDAFAVVDGCRGAKDAAIRSHDAVHDLVQMAVKEVDVDVSA